jgi:tripartite-type tricarboxylate transporter receptor subunit TctC
LRFLTSISDQLNQENSRMKHSVPRRIHLARVLRAALLCAAPVLPALAQSDASSYPSRPVRYINPNAAGASSDIIARSFAAELTKQLGQQVFVDNRPGAGSTLGSMEGARAPADGYTLTQTSSPLFAVVPHLYSKLSFDPVKDFRSIIVLTAFQNVLVVHPSVPAKTVKELVALAKKEPGKLTYGSTGNGTTTHLSGELFRQMTGADIVHVPYRSGAPALNDLLGGQVKLMFNNVPASLQHIRAGTLRAIAVTGTAREESLPEVPTMVESSIENYEAVGWFSLSVPAATPQAVVDKLSAAAMKAAADPGFRKAMKDNGFVVVGGTPQQMDKMIQTEINRWGPVVKLTGMKID